jgi:hypothetical protein
MAVFWCKNRSAGPFVAALGLLLLLLLGSRVRAQVAGNDTLATAKALRCVFSLVATGAWNNGAAQAKLTQTELRMVFTSINIDEGTAESLGQFGRSDIIARLSSRALHLIESFREGPVYMTTVFNSESRPGKLESGAHTARVYRCQGVGVHVQPGAVLRRV